MCALKWVPLPHSGCCSPGTQAVFILLYLQYNKFRCTMEQNYFLNNAADWIISQQQNQKSTDVSDIFKLITNTSQQKQAHGTWIHFPVPTIWSVPMIINLAHAQLYFQIHLRKKSTCFSVFTLQSFCCGHLSLALHSHQHRLQIKHVIAQFCRCWNDYMVVASWQQLLNIWTEIFQLLQTEVKNEVWNRWESEGWVGGGIGHIHANGFGEG